MSDETIRTFPKLNSPQEASYSQKVMLANHDLQISRCLAKFLHLNDQALLLYCQYLEELGLGYPSYVDWFFN